MDISEVGYVVDHAVWMTPQEATEAWGSSIQVLYQKKYRGRFPNEFILQDDYNWWVHVDCPPIVGRSKNTKHPQP